LHDESYVGELLRAARGLVMGNPILRDVVERASAGPEEIIHAVAAALSAAGGAAPLRLPMRALVCIARAAWQAREAGGAEPSQ
jgi:hypothetical protein